MSADPQLDRYERVLAAYQVRYEALGEAEEVARWAEVAFEAEVIDHPHSLAACQARDAREAALEHLTEVREWCAFAEAE